MDETAEEAELLGLGQSLISSIEQTDVPMMLVVLRKGTAAAHYVMAVREREPPPRPALAVGEVLEGVGGAVYSAASRRSLTSCVPTAMRR